MMHSEGREEGGGSLCLPKKNHQLDHKNVIKHENRNSQPQEPNSKEFAKKLMAPPPTWSLSYCVPMILTNLSKLQLSPPIPPLLAASCRWVTYNTLERLPKKVLYVTV